jgi:hypothetical protein
MECAGLPWDFRTQDKRHAGSALHPSVTAFSVKKTLTINGGILTFLILPREKLRARHQAVPSSPEILCCALEIRAGPIVARVKSKTALDCAESGDCAQVPSSLRARDTEWTHRHVFKFPTVVPVAHTVLKIRNGGARFSCAGRVIKE